MVTIREVARRSGFSATTVSFVLNDSPMVKQIPEETRERIRKAAEELGYRPNVLAKYLRTRHTRTIGVVLFDVTDPYCTHVFHGVQEALLESGTYLPVVVDTQNNQAHFRRSVRMLLERQVEGLVILANSLYAEDELLGTVRECSIPVVMIGRRMKDDVISSVTVENDWGARLALEHLYKLGHRQIAFIRGPKNFIDSGQRWAGATEFAREVGLKIDASLVVNLPPRRPNYEGGFELTREILSRKRRFTALTAFDDMSAFGAIRALENSGIRVPADCSVIGFDDIATSAYYNPPLTTVRQNMGALGSAGVDILLSAIGAAARQEEWTPVHRAVSARLVVRESTAPCVPDALALPAAADPLPA